jgi:geranylgeranyl reductase family protein
VKTVAVLGGGPAGSTAAARLASAGLDTILLDEKLAWEKPCGGGVTYKAYHQYPHLFDNPTPKARITSTVLRAPRAGAFQMELTQPLLIYPRLHLNRMLLERAGQAGARIEKERVTALERSSNGWRIRTRHGAIEADYCVVATGARNALRNVGTQYSAADTMFALGYYVPVTRRHIDIQFFSNFEGYIWVFPRPDHLSVGICGKGEPAGKLRQRLNRWMEEQDIPLKDASFFGHMLPALERPSFASNRVSGEGWAGVGDAAGLVDPVTGEGIYYAIRSGDLAAQSILNDTLAPAERHRLYSTALRGEFLDDLTFAAGLAKRFFVQRFLFSSVPDRMIQLMRHSPSMTLIVQDLFAGTQNYLELKKRLMGSLNGTMLEIFMGFMLGNRVVKEGEL